MEYKKPFDSYAQDAHEKAQAAIDYATEVRTTAADELRKKHEKEHREAHLIDDGGIMRCSVCKFPFDLGVKPSLTVAFTEHLFKAHQPGQCCADRERNDRELIQILKDFILPPYKLTQQWNGERIFSVSVFVNQTSIRQCSQHLIDVTHYQTISPAQC